MTDPEVSLEGGFLTEIVRVGDTVRRATGPWTPWVEQLLRFLRSSGFDAAPEPLGADERGRQVLRWIEGETRRGRETDDAVLMDVMRLVRRLHDLTAGTELAAGAECVVHRDLSPRNTVYRDGRPVALIDWDGAGPGPRIEDVSRACWQFTDPTPRSDPAEIARRWALMADAYGLDGAATSALVAEVVARLEENADGIEARAAAGSDGHRRLVELGAPVTIRSVRDWVVAHRADLERGLGAAAN